MFYLLAYKFFFFQIRSSTLLSLTVVRAAFDGLAALTSLDLGGQPLKMAGQALCSLPSLQHLHLPTSYITSLDDLGKIFGSRQFLVIKKTMQSSSLLLKIMIAVLQGHVFCIKSIFSSCTPLWEIIVFPLINAFFSPLAIYFPNPGGGGYMYM